MTLARSVVGRALVLEDDLTTPALVEPCLISLVNLVDRLAQWWGFWMDTAWYDKMDDANFMNGLINELLPVEVLTGPPPRLCWVGV